MHNREKSEWKKRDTKGFREYSENVLHTQNVTYTYITYICIYIQYIAFLVLALIFQFSGIYIYLFYSNVSFCLFWLNLRISKCPQDKLTLAGLMSLSSPRSFFFFFNKFIYLFIFVCIGSLLPCAGFSLWWLLLAWSQALGTRVSVVVACGLSSCGSWALEHRRSSCGARAQLLRGMWDPPGPGLEPVSPALAGRFLTTVPPGKSFSQILKRQFLVSNKIFDVFKIFLFILFYLDQLLQFAKAAVLVLIICTPVLGDPLLSYHKAEFGIPYLS